MVLRTATEWKNTGLVPTSGLLAWHMYEAGASGHHIIFDYSGNGRTIDSPTLNAPVLTSNVLYGYPGWYFDGASSTEPLNWSGSLTVKHGFVLASHQDAAFNLNRGLLTGETSGDILVSNNSGTDFFDISGTVPDFGYRKSDVLYAQNNQEAPMGGQAELLEFASSTGIGLDGIQVGKQRNLANRVWKGFFFEQLLYDRILTSVEKDRIKLYFNLKFSQWRVGLPFYFPSDDILEYRPRRSRFYAEPPRYQDITDSYEFEDRGRTFNEVADEPPRRWEYQYLRRPPEQALIFDAFWDQARTANPFIFRDKSGVEWSDVRIESYNRQHQKHLSMFNDIDFRLIQYP